MSPNNHQQPPLKINCDIGERGSDNQVDITLMGHVQIANIACGGHAGDLETIGTFTELARKNNVEVSAHLSYPDLDNFGRVHMELPFSELKTSLNRQLDNMPDVYTVKFHGALYNDSCVDPELAESLSVWLASRGMHHIICPGRSRISEKCCKRGIQIISEAFAERRYAYTQETGTMTLVSRKKEYACIRDLAQAIEQVKLIQNFHRVVALVEKKDGLTARRLSPIQADTVCIHSDSDIALELAMGLKKLVTQDGKDETLEELEIQGNGMYSCVDGPEYGKQDLGYSPGGPQDRFSCGCGNILLGNPHHKTALEIIYPPKVRFGQDVLFTLVGARYDQVYLHGNKQPIEQAVVYKAKKGERLSFGKRVKGFRAYLCTRPYSDEISHIVGRARGPFSDICSWSDPDNYIRLVEGPEHGWLGNPDMFFLKKWTTSKDMSGMGIRLKAEGDSILASSDSMISSAVADGTIQLTSTGPIILMRGRQTTGGYPRIFNVISADLDMLAQYGPGQRVKFKLVDMDEARRTAEKWISDLKRFESSLKENNPMQ